MDEERMSLVDFWMAPGEEVNFDRLSAPPPWFEEGPEDEE